MTPEQAVAWAAGLFEGEGCIHLSLSSRPRGYLRPRLLLTTTDRDIVYRFFAVVRCGYVKGPFTRPGNKPFWTWRCAKADDVRRILIQFGEFLGERRSAKAAAAFDALAKLPGLPEGGRHWRAKLSVEDVKTIRSLGGVTQRELAERYGVSQSQISDIKLFRCWRHVA